MAESLNGFFPVTVHADLRDGMWRVCIPSMPSVAACSSSLKVAEDRCIERALSLIDDWKEWKLRQDAAAIEAVFTEGLKNEPTS